MSDKNNNRRKVISPIGFNYKSEKPIIVDDWPKFYTGTIYKSVLGDYFEIVEYVNSINVKIRFLDGSNYETVAPLNSIKSGYVKNPYHRYKYGQILGEGPYSRKDHTKIYDTWHGIFVRINQPGPYSKTSICEEWLNFQVFAAWYENYLSMLNLDYIYQLDKDVFQWNQEYKIYSPQTCCLIPTNMNNILGGLFTERKQYPDLPIGVYRSDTVAERYTATIQYNINDRVNLGSYNTPIEAFEAYKKAKENHIKQMADIY